MAEATTPADVAALPHGARTRFAPAPTGFLHLGHVANAIWVWGVAGATDGRVLLRIEDHDRGALPARIRGRPARGPGVAGLRRRRGPVSANRTTTRRTLAALERLRGEVLVYGCDCSRSTFEAWSHEHGRLWHGPGLPGRLPAIAAWTGPVLRVALGGGSERWMDAIVGPCADEVAAGAGDLPIRDRDGNWTYGFAVVVDDLRQDVGLVFRGRDLLSATAAQIRLARLLGRETPAVFAHHPLIRRPDGAKLSKADGDTSVRDLRAAGRSRRGAHRRGGRGGRADRRSPADRGGRGGEPVRRVAA